MRAKIIFLIALICMVSHAAAFAGGSGTAADPYQVADVDDLQLMNNYTSSHFIQINDIDASVTSTWHSGGGFVPVGTSSNLFTGTYNGQGYTIDGLHINVTAPGWIFAVNGIGMFGYTDGATIYNVAVTNASIKGRSNVGIVAGYARSSTMYQIYTSGSVTATQINGSGGINAGGIAGLIDGGTSISNVYTTASVTAVSSAGGAIGNSVSIANSITNSYAAGTVSSAGAKYGFSRGSGTATSNYYDSTVSGLSDTQLATPKTTAEMQTQSTFVGWDFNNVWIMSGYPILYSQISGDFYLYPGNETILRNAPPLLHSVTIDMFRKGAISYDITIATDDLYTNVVYSANKLSSGGLANLTQTVSLEARTYYMQVEALDGSGNTLDTATSTFTISQTIDLGSTSVAGNIYEIISGVNTPISNVKVTLYNDTVSYDYITSSNGYYQFTGLANSTTYNMVAVKNGYEDSTLNVFTSVNGSTVTKNILMQKEEAPNYITPHYVRFVPKWMWLITYDDLTVTVYEGNSATPYDSDITGSDGAVGFELSETVKYRITVVNADREINDVFYITPTKNEYILPIGMGDDYEQIELIDGMTFAITKSQINTSSGYINCTYSVPSSTFTGATFIINDYNGTELYVLTSSNANHTFNQIVPAANDTYLCNLTILDSSLDDPYIASAIVSFYNGIREEFNFGWENDWNYQVLSVVIIILLGTLAGAVHAPIMALVQGFFFTFTLYAGWMPSRLDVIFMGALAIVLSFAMAMRKGEEGMR